MQTPGLWVRLATSFALFKNTWDAVMRTRAHAPPQTADSVPPTTFEADKRQVDLHFEKQLKFLLYPAVGLPELGIGLELYAQWKEQSYPTPPIPATAPSCLTIWSMAATALISRLSNQCGKGVYPRERTEFMSRCWNASVLHNVLRAPPNLLMDKPTFKQVIGCYKAGMIGNLDDSRWCVFDTRQYTVALPDTSLSIR